MTIRKILIVEDQTLARTYLCSCVEKCTDCEVAGTLTRADAALRRCGEGHIDLILMDICTESDSDGLAAAESIKKSYPWIKIVIEGTLSGKNFWPDGVPTVRLGKTLSCELSEREMETLRLLCEGKTNVEIAVELNVAESSVRTYINRMLEKTGYPNRNRLMIAAVGRRMVVPGCWLEEHEEI